MTIRRRGRRLRDLASIVTILIVVGASLIGWAGRQSDGSVSAAPSASWTPTAAQIRAAKTQLASVRVVPELPDTPGYQRGCGRGKACSFGPAWTDDSSAPDSHNSCGTRDDVLREQLRNTMLRNGSRCVIVAGELHDPYTGASIAFTKAHATAVQVDHLMPLARVWRSGAATWTQAERTSYANDTKRVLIAADGSSNESKGDRGPGEWMPPNAGYRCMYSVRYVAVARHYRLEITSADREALSNALTHCG